MYLYIIALIKAIMVLYMSNIKEEIQKLEASALVEFFILDLSLVIPNTKRYFHSGTNELNGNVVWQGIEYQRWPVLTEGFAKSGQGVLPRPKVQVSNLGGMLSGDLIAFDDLVGCQVTRKQTLVKFLDAVNFKDGNPHADPEQYFDDEIWFIEQKTMENRYYVEFELASPFDLEGVMLPYRQILKNYCTWSYRGPECGYTGPYFDKDGKPTSNVSEDVCGKKVKDCKVRQPYFANNVLPFGGFPGATKYAN